MKIEQFLYETLSELLTQMFYSVIFFVSLMFRVIATGSLTDFRPFVCSGNYGLFLCKGIFRTFRFFIALLVADNLIHDELIVEGFLRDFFPGRSKLRFKTPSVFCTRFPLSYRGSRES